MCLDFGTPKYNKFSIATNRKCIILGVSILKHIRVAVDEKVHNELLHLDPQCLLSKSLNSQYDSFREAPWSSG